MNNSAKTIPFLFFIIISFMFLFLNYQQVYSKRVYFEKDDYSSTLINPESITFKNSYESDTPEHINFISQYFNNKKYLPHPMWHSGTYIISKLPFISLPSAAVIFSTFIMSIWLILLFLYLNYEFKRKHISYINKPLIFFFTLYAIIFVGPMILPIVDYLIFYGKGSPSIWHNITIWMVKPFAFASIISIFFAINTNNNKYYLVSFILAILSLFAKPSFIIMFLPALFIFALINTVQSKKFYLFLITLSITSIVILLYQFKHTFSSSEVVIAPFFVWSITSIDIPLSILLGLLFPISYSLLNLKTLHSKLFQLVWIQVFIGIFLYISFAQTGASLDHANFIWSYMIAMNFIYVISITNFMLNFKELAKYKQIVLFTILLIQLSIGTYYFYQVINGQHPVFASIWFLR